MNSAQSPAASDPASDATDTDGATDEGRRYWKAAIAHLAPEKREAAWEFYLDRLESSAAADTLGGVMLLLEAHLAFFDDLPARLGLAAQQLQSAVHPRGSLPMESLPSGIANADGAGDSPPFPKRRALFWAVATLAAVLAVSLAAGAAFSHQRSPHAPAVPVSPRAPRILLTRAQRVSVEPWLDSAAHRERGCVVCFERAAWSECTAAGGLKVYVLSPAEEVRRDLESLRQVAAPPAPEVP